MNIERRLAEAGYRMFTTGNNREDLIQAILETRDIRYLKAVPFLIYKHDLDLRRVYEKTKDKALFSRIILHTSRIFLELGIPKRLPLFPQGRCGLKLSYEELKDEFRLHYEAGQEQELLTEKQRIEEERYLRVWLSRLFTRKERQIMERILQAKPISKTDYEYYSRKTKKKLESVVNLQDFAKTQLALRPRPDERLYRLKKLLEAWIEASTQHKKPQIIRFFVSDSRISITFKKKDAPLRDRLFDTVKGLKEIKDRHILSLLEDYSRGDFS